MAGKKHLTEEHKRKIGEANMGKKSWCAGKKMSPEFGEKIRKTHLERGICPSELCRQKCVEATTKDRSAPGTYRKIAFEKLGLERKCEFCGSDYQICIHHEDRDKSNNCRGNIIILCKPCHTSLHFSRGDINRWLIRSQGSE